METCLPNYNFGFGYDTYWFNVEVLKTNYNRFKNQNQEQLKKINCNNQPSQDLEVKICFNIKDKYKQNNLVF